MPSSGSLTCNRNLGALRNWGGTEVPRPTAGVYHRGTHTQSAISFDTAGPVEIVVTASAAWHGWPGAFVLVLQLCTAYPQATGNGSGSMREHLALRRGRLMAAVSREQLRQGSALSNRHFDSTTAEVCATIKLRTGPWANLGKSTLVVKH